MTVTETLADVKFVVGGGQNLALVDEIDPEGLENLGLDNVADAALGHNGNRDGSLDLLERFEERIVVLPHAKRVVVDQKAQLRQLVLE